MWEAPSKAVVLFQPTPRERARLPQITWPYNSYEFQPTRP